MGYRLRTLSLFTMMTAILMGVGALLGYIFSNSTYGMFWGLGIMMVISVAMNVLSYFYSKNMVLRMHKVKLITRADNPRLYNIVEDVAMRANLPMPEVGIVNNDTPNAFATGRNPKNAAVVATSGIMRILSDEELRGVIAHEMAHVNNRDVLVMTVASTVAGMISYLSSIVMFGTFFRDTRDNPLVTVLAILSYVLLPIAAMLVQLAISRSREYNADKKGAEIIGNPISLANALRKLEAGNTAKPMDHENPSSSNLWIVNPFGGKKGAVSLFSTHPPMEERIRKLEEQARKMGL